MPRKQQKYATEEPVHYTVDEDHTTMRGQSMSMIDPTEWELENSHEPYALSDGTEASLRVIEVTKSVREDKSEYYSIRLEAPAEPFSKDITHWLNVPSNRLDAKRLNAARNEMLKFCLCFKVDITKPFDPISDWVGLEGWCVLSLRVSDQYGEQNRVAKFIIPQ